MPATSIGEADGSGGLASACDGRASGARDAFGEGTRRFVGARAGRGGDVGGEKRKEEREL